MLFRSLLKGHVGVAGPHDASHEEEEGGRFAAFYRRVMSPLMDRPSLRTGFYGVVILLLLGSVVLIGVKAVQVKMLPFDNKSEFQVVLDLPEGRSLETSQAAAQEIAQMLRAVPEVVSTETYAGTSAPVNFNGLVRHYYMRRGASVADIQVNLLDKKERRAQSHDIALRVRPAVQAIAKDRKSTRLNSSH